MLQFHAVILPAKLSTYEDRHGKLLGDGGRAQNTYAHCKNTRRNQCNAAVYLNLCDFLKTNLSTDGLKKWNKISIYKKSQIKHKLLTQQKG